MNSWATEELKYAALPDKRLIKIEVRAISLLSGYLANSDRPIDTVINAIA
jgi:hypothetical protein